jgi:hypothetical protein
MKAESLIEVIKWSLLIIITGFFAQFGKTFAQYLMKRAKTHQRRAFLRQEDTTPATTVNPDGGSGGAPEAPIADVPINRGKENRVTLDKNTQKILKKRNKTALKKLKKHD